MRTLPIPSLPDLPNCTYISNESLLLAESDACNRVLPPRNAQLNSSTSVEVTSRDFFECLADVNSTMCEMEQLCSICDQLFCQLHVCEVAANNNVRRNQTNLDVYTKCFIAVCQSLVSPPTMLPDLPPNMAPNMPPTKTLLDIAIASWFEYCLDETSDYEACIYFYAKICVSEVLPGFTSECLLEMSTLCGSFETDLEQQQECLSTVATVLRVTVSSMCGQSENVETCVSS